MDNVCPGRASSEGTCLPCYCAAALLSSVGFGHCIFAHISSICFVSLTKIKFANRIIIPVSKMDHHLQLCLLSNLGKRKTGFKRSVIMFLFKEESTPVNKPARLERSDNKVPVSMATYLGKARQGSFVYIARFIHRANQPASRREK